MAPEGLPVRLKVNRFGQVPEGEEKAASDRAVRLACLTHLYLNSHEWLLCLTGDLIRRQIWRKYTGIHIYVYP